MTLPLTGPLSASQINVEIGNASTAQLNIGGGYYNGTRQLAGQFGSGPVSFSSMRGKTFVREHVVYITSSQNWTVPSTFTGLNDYNQPSTLSVYLIGGGGGGGAGDANGGGGGGGAGELLRSVQPTVVAGQTYSITIGAGGTGGYGYGGMGGATTAFGFTAAGGGGGGNSGARGSDGASGGGSGAYYSQSFATGLDGANYYAQVLRNGELGHNGGLSINSGGGGGGGAGAPSMEYAQVGAYGAMAGPGVYIPYWNTAQHGVCGGGGGGGGPGGYGGGAGEYVSGYSKTTPGLFGGGNGGNDGVRGDDATANTGGGGGGGGANAPGGDGAAGLVMIIGYW